MERRDCIRKNTDMDGILKHDNVASLIRITNCSENGLCIVSVMDVLNCSSKVDILIHSDDDYLKISGRVARISEQCEDGYAVGISFSNPPLDYIELLEGL